MKLKALLLTLTLGLVALPAFAEDTSVHQSTGYFTLGAGPVPVPLPAVGVGYRTQHDHLGLDLAIVAQPLIVATAVSQRALFTYYPTPNLDGQVYLGAGIGVHTALIHAGKEKNIQVSASPEFTIGKQYRTDKGGLRMLSADVSLVNADLKPSKARIPLVTINYGIGF